VRLPAFPLLSPLTGHSECILGIAIIHVRATRYQEALEVLLALDHFSNDTALAELVASTPRAKTQVQKPYPYCLYLRGVVHQLNRDYAKAIADFTPAIEMGRLLIAQRERAFCYFAIGPLSLAFLLSFVELYPSLPGDFENATSDANAVVEGIEWEHIVDEDDSKFA